MLVPPPARTRVTIARLMIVVAMFAVLFALPGDVAKVLSGLVASLLFAWGSSAIVARIVKPTSRRSDAPERIAALAIASVVFDIVAWVACVIGVMPQGPMSLGLRFLILALSAFVGTIAFVLALSALLAGPETLALPWKLLSALVAITSWPFYLGLGMGGVSAIVSMFGGR